MDKNNELIPYNNCKHTNPAKVLYMKDYSEMRQTLKNREEEYLGKESEKLEGKVTYLDEDRKKTLDLFLKVLYTMKKENFQ